jgi:hypothetical protein
MKYLLGCRTLSTVAWTVSYNGRGNSGESVWDAYNGFTDWLSHERGSDKNRLHQNQWGPGAAINSRALNVALQLAG